MSGRGNFRVRSEETGWEGTGGYMEAKIRKLEQQFDEDLGSSRQISSIFRGVTILVDGWTIPSADELKMIMSRNGGKYHMYYSRTKTTHVIASNLPHAKRKQLRTDQKVVKPQWITDSLKAKALLPVEKYLVVPIEEGGQSRMTGLLVKRKAEEKGIGSSSSFALSNLPKQPLTCAESDQVKIADQSDQGKNELEQAFCKTSKLGRSICPTTDSNFLSEFYSHSRLHFLSTWKMELKEYVRSLQSEESLKEIPLSGYKELLRIAKTEGSQPRDRGCAVMHIDMDCFFVSVGLRSRPELRGLPVAVTHSTGTGLTSDRRDADPEFEMNYYQKKYGGSSTSTGTISSKLSSAAFGPGFSSSEIASCSYEARAAGVKNGMFVGKAKQLCPELRVIPYDFESYRRTSDQLYSTLASFTRHIEAVSCDEALVDISKLLKETGLPPIRVASSIRHAVKKATGCNASAGVGPNITLARMATRHAKPDGEFVVAQHEAKEFMKSLSVKDLPGVGRSTASRLHEMGLPTCEDLQKFSVGLLKQEFGAKTGQKLHDMSCGIDKREVEIEKERKSVSAEINYGIRLSNDEEAKTFLSNLAKEVTKRLKSAGMRGKRITLKVMVRRSDAPLESAKFGGHGVCDSISRSSQMSLTSKGDIYEEDCTSIHEAAWSILSSLHLNVTDLRGIGIQVTQLHPADSCSSVAESSSATFLKKFVVKKSELPKAEEGPDRFQDDDHLVSESAAVTLHPGATDHVSNLSFLDALPLDLRKEVEENLAQQREALERNFLNNENSNDSNGSSVQIIDESSRGSTSDVLFCEQGKLSTGPKPAQKPKHSQGKRGKTNNTTKVSTSKSTSRKARNSDTSPSKLITDMFPVIYSPSKTATSPATKQRMSPHSIPQRSSATTRASRAKRKLVSIEEEVAMQVSDGERCQSPAAAELVPDVKEVVRPCLGGAYEIQEIRPVLNEWVDTCMESGPLDCDVDDFISFLTDTARYLRDLEKVYLTLKSFRRKLLSFGKDVIEFSGWTRAYDKVCNKVQNAVRDSYRGGILDLRPL